MSFIGTVASALTDPGSLVKDAVNSTLPKDLTVVGDLAAAALDLKYPAHQAQGIQHALDAVRDLPQALPALINSTKSSSGQGAHVTSALAKTWSGSPAFEPPPPPRPAQVNVSISSNGQISITINTPNSSAGPPGTGPAAPSTNGAPSGTGSQSTPPAAPNTSGTASSTGSQNTTPATPTSGTASSTGSQNTTPAAPNTSGTASSTGCQNQPALNEKQLADILKRLLTHSHHLGFGWIAAVLPHHGTASSSGSNNGTSASGHPASTSPTSGSSGSAATSSTAGSSGSAATSSTAGSSGSSNPTSGSGHSGSASSSSSTAASTSTGATKGASDSGGISSKDKIASLSNADFMNAIRTGNISDDVAKDPAAMLQIQERMNQITQMNQLMSQMMAAMHQMAMSTIQNIRA
jgi:hypothetical protein